MNKRTNRAVAAHTPKNRPARVPLGQGKRLDVPDHLKHDGFHQYWFIDRPGQIESAVSAWYDFVLDEGQKVTRPAGNGETHYLMEIDQETYDKDMRVQQDLITETEKASFKVKSKEYSPEGHGSAVTKD